MRDGAPGFAALIGDGDPRRILNGSGAWTSYGANRVGAAPVAAMAAALARSIDMAAFGRAAGRRIAACYGTEDGHVTGSTAGSLAIVSAALLAGTDDELIRSLPDTHGIARREIVLQAGHDCDFGARISQMLRLSGAVPRLAGTSDGCDRQALDAAISTATAGGLYVVSYEAANDDCIRLEPFAALFAARGIPVVVDASGQDDADRFLVPGVAAVLVSAQKLMGGPTAGLIAGRRWLIEACRAQGVGIGRAMKASKEAIAGAIMALEAHAGRDRGAWWRAQAARGVALAAAGERAGLAYSRATYPAPIFGENIRVRVDPAVAGFSAAELVVALDRHDPRVVVRSEGTPFGHFDIALFNLTDPEAVEIGKIIRSLCLQGETDDPA